MASSAKREEDASRTVAALRNFKQDFKRARSPEAKSLEAKSFEAKSLEAICALT
jgi:hypothetical protein